MRKDKVSKEVFLDKPQYLAGSYTDSSIRVGVIKLKGKILDTERYHSHSKLEEFYLFLKGKGEMLIEDEIIPVEEGDFIEVKVGEKHMVSKVYGELHYIAIKKEDGDDRVFHDNKI
jgi:mannose-6-phosphate isomerase-like protein (cupin superfamily)